MHKNDNNANNNKDTSKMQYFAAKANPYDNILNANPALCKYSTAPTIKTTAQIMH